MTIRAFLGGAGCGKTHQLMLALSEYLERTPLQDGQKVLAMTFMHGSRRRLDERLSLVPGLARKHECSTLDSFAWRIVLRWKALVLHLGFGHIAIGDYSRVCEAAAAILEHEIVVKWVAATFPIMVLDEAQDLTQERLRIIVALASRIEILAAADEFQCLDEQLRPNPACNWLIAAGAVKDLIVPHRTNVKALLAAATNIRAGAAPISIKPFEIKLTSRPALAGTWIANELGWYGYGKRVAIITPTSGQFATKVIDWVGVNTTKRGNGPFNINWERSQNVVMTEFIVKLKLPEIASQSEVEAAIRVAGDLRVLEDVMWWTEVQRRTKGKTTFVRAEIESAIRQSFDNRKHDHKEPNHGFAAMTVHGAKNREFDNVIVLWPAAMIGSEDQKRRLLYNAVTRARFRCLVLVQAQASLQQAPFA